MLVARGQKVREGDAGHSVQTAIYRTGKGWGPDIQQVTAV